MAAGDWYQTASTSAVLELRKGDKVNVKAGRDTAMVERTGEGDWRRWANVFSGNLIVAADCY